ARCVAAADAVAARRRGTRGAVDPGGVPAGPGQPRGAALARGGRAHRAALLPLAGARAVGADAEDGRRADGAAGLTSGAGLTCAAAAGQGDMRLSRLRCYHARAM